METEKTSLESESGPRDISEECMSMSFSQFNDFLRSLRHEPALSITIDWAGVSKAMQLKAFLEDSDALRRDQERTATIRATEAQYKQGLNVFASRVKWEKVEE